ncbi:hypothetical protein OAN21_02320 [Alphaproteobacteria bacterium]|nr:hypothetical protein [Alphaproteobacteria bacterium]
MKYFSFLVLFASFFSFLASDAVSAAAAAAPLEVDHSSRVPCRPVIINDHPVPYGSDLPPSHSNGIIANKMAFPGENGVIVIDGGDITVGSYEAPPGIQSRYDLVADAYRGYVDHYGDAPEEQDSFRMKCGRGKISIPRGVRGPGKKSHYVLEAKTNVSIGEEGGVDFIRTDNLQFVGSRIELNSILLVEGVGKNCLGSGGAGKIIVDEGPYPATDKWRDCTVNNICMGGVFFTSGGVLFHPPGDAGSWLKGVFFDFGDSPFMALNGTLSFDPSSTKGKFFAIGAQSVTFLYGPPEAIWSMPEGVDEDGKVVPVLTVPKQPVTSSAEGEEEDLVSKLQGLLSSDSKKDQPFIAPLD